jgi:hypothetical protein
MWGSWEGRSEVLVLIGMVQEHGIIEVDTIGPADTDFDLSRESSWWYGSGCCWQVLKRGVFVQQQRVRVAETTCCNGYTHRS